MRKVISLPWVIITSFILSLNPLSVNVDNSIEFSDICSITDPVEIVKIEYVLIDGDWYLYIYYSDGSIDIQSTSHPPND